MPSRPSFDPIKDARADELTQRNEELTAQLVIAGQTVEIHQKTTDESKAEWRQMMAELDGARAELTKAKHQADRMPELQRQKDELTAQLTTAKRPARRSASDTVPSWLLSNGS